MTISAKRTIVVPAIPSQTILPLNLRWPTSQPQDYLDYTLDVQTDLMDVLEVLQEVDLSISPSGVGELQASQLTASLGVITVWLEGGVPGRTYTVTLLTFGVYGHEWEYPVTLTVNPNLAKNPIPPPPNLGPGPTLVWPVAGVLGFTTNGYLLQLESVVGWPTSSSVPGMVYANGLLVGAVPSAYPAGPPVFFGGVTANQLLARGAFGLGGVDPGVFGQLWLNGELVAASAGSNPWLGLFVNGIAVTLESTAGWPTSSAGLLPGDLWANGLFVNAVSGTTPNPAAAPVYFGLISATELLVLGAGNFPLSDPQSFGQFWLNGVQICVSQG